MFTQPTGSKERKPRERNKQTKINKMADLM